MPNSPVVTLLHVRADGTAVGVDDKDVLYIGTPAEYGFDETVVEITETDDGVEKVLRCGGEVVGTERLVRCAFIEDQRQRRLRELTATAEGQDDPPTAKQLAKAADEQAEVAWQHEVTGDVPHEKLFIDALNAAGELIQIERKRLVYAWEAR